MERLGTILQQSNRDQAHPCACGDDQLVIAEALPRVARERLLVDVHRGDVGLQLVVDA